MLEAKVLKTRPFIAVYHQNKQALRPNIIPTIMANAGASHIAAKFGISGPVFTYSTACSSSTHAIGHAFWMIRHGVIDTAIAGGSEAPLCFANLKAWEACELISNDACQTYFQKSVRHDSGRRWRNDYSGIVIIRAYIVMLTFTQK